MKKKEKQENYFSSGKGELVMLRNKDLDCNDCNFALEVAGVCRVYPDVKPKAVLQGGKCKRKEK